MELKEGWLERQLTRASETVDTWSEAKKEAMRLDRKTQLKDGEPCSHIGCLSHVTHPCETCGRIGGKQVNPFEKACREFLKSCSCATKDEPQGCPECTTAFVRHIQKLVREGGS